MLNLLFNIRKENKIPLRLKHYFKLSKKSSFVHYSGSGLRFSLKSDEFTPSYDFYLPEYQNRIKYCFRSEDIAFQSYIDYSSDSITSTKEFF